MWSPIACTFCKAAASSNPATRISPSSSNGAVTGSSATPRERCGTTPMSAVVDFPVKPEARPYLDAFASGSRGEPEWLAARRRRDLTRFAEQGFPSRRSEAWRYIELRALAERPKLPNAGLAAAPDPRPRAALGQVALGGGTHLVVLV